MVNVRTVMKVCIYFAFVYGLGVLTVLAVGDFDQPLDVEEEFGPWYGAPFRSWRRRARALRDLKTNTWFRFLTKSVSGS